MAEGCDEKLNPAFVLRIGNYPKSTRPRVVCMLKSNPLKKKIVWLRSRSAVESFLARTGKSSQLSSSAP